MPKGGARKGAGRKKGVPNHITSELEAKLAKLGCDPIQGMAKLANDPECDPTLRGRMYSELAQYVLPKRKAVEHSGTGENGAIEHVFRWSNG